MTSVLKITAGGSFEPEKGQAKRDSYRLWPQTSLQGQAVKLGPVFGVCPGKLGKLYGELNVTR
ncbi:hypothetical protein [Vibrio quintilis]|uniref:Uncharacterized protein n=1 Tax=Vibrio quintilis TaxID=1117707 RepID=A0A1M7YQU6_9VIBR|nr:hypothetical protein [Vibrio quintilis]SHO55002.1 hypothetical protein VQ7734_00721 [Vibrio quintilis]